MNTEDFLIRKIYKMKPKDGDIFFVKVNRHFGIGEYEALRKILLRVVDAAQPKNIKMVIVTPDVEIVKGDQKEYDRIIRLDSVVAEIKSDQG